MPRTAVLFSGGLDSAVLLARELEGHEAQRGTQPIHIRAGLAWEDAEARTIERLLGQPPFAGRVAPVITLSFDMRDVYPPTHWAITGSPPAYDTPDEDVFLEGRNIVLISKAAVLCGRLNIQPDEDVFLEGRNIVLISKAAVLCGRLNIQRLALGLLAGNPFPDATPEFFEVMSRAMSLGLGSPLDIVAPLASMTKTDVIRLGRELCVPLDLTLSCMNPQAGDQPCSQCSKCRERDQAFSSLSDG
jgi:7-cyano-7-deazaguanine synthase